MDNKDDAIVTDPAAIEAALADSVPVALLPRCDCPALDVPHVHEQGGPVALDPSAR